MADITLKLIPVQRISKQRRCIYLLNLINPEPNLSQFFMAVAAVTLRNTSLVGQYYIICNISAVRYFYVNFAT